MPVRSAAERPARDACRHATEEGMTGRLWIAQVPGNRRRAKTGHGAQAEKATRSAVTTRFRMDRSSESIELQSRCGIPSYHGRSWHER